MSIYTRKEVFIDPEKPITNNTPVNRNINREYQDDPNGDNWCPTCRNTGWIRQGVKCPTCSKD